MDAACQCPGAKRSRRRSALLAERGLTGRDPRPYPLPASEWRELPLRLTVFRCFLEQLAGS